MLSFISVALVMVSLYSNKTLTKGVSHWMWDPRKKMGTLVKGASKDWGAKDRCLLKGFLVDGKILVKQSQR